MSFSSTYTRKADPEVSAFLVNKKRFILIFAPKLEKDFGYGQKIFKFFVMKAQICLTEKKKGELSGGV